MNIRRLLAKTAVALIEHELRKELRSHGIDLDKFVRELQFVFEMAEKPRGQNPFLTVPTMPHAKAYRVLGLTPPASQAEVKTAYKSLVCANHPDKHNNSPASHKRLKDIVSAYNALKETSS